jgi:hypothetical protein
MGGQAEFQTCQWKFYEMCVNVGVNDSVKIGSPYLGGYVNSPPQS